MDRSRRVARKPNRLSIDGAKVRATGERLGPEQNGKAASTDTEKYEARNCGVDGGISLADHHDENGRSVIISSIEEDSPFRTTGLVRGMEVVKINGYNCSDANFGQKLLNREDGRIQIVAKAGTAVISTPQKKKNKKKHLSSTPLTTLIGNTYRGLRITNRFVEDAVKRGTSRSFMKTPGKTTGRNQRDFDLSLKTGIECVGASLLPTKDPEVIEVEVRKSMERIVAKSREHECGKLLLIYLMLDFNSSYTHTLNFGINSISA